jgi:RNA polymerase sigma-70 factor (ECF subfamily)
VHADRSRRVSRERRDAVVRAFGAACRGGDLAALTALLDPDVTLRSDGGGVVTAARNPVRGVANVTRFLLGILAKEPSARVEEAPTGDGLAYVHRDDAGRVRGVFNFRVAEDRITDVWIVLNPAKLTRW